jgi:hypothetical protein
LLLLLLLQIGIIFAAGLTLLELILLLSKPLVEDTGTAVVLVTVVGRIMILLTLVQLSPLLLLSTVAESADSFSCCQGRRSFILVDHRTELLRD